MTIKILLTNDYDKSTLEIIRECVPFGFETRLMNSFEEEDDSEFAKIRYILAGGRRKIDGPFLDLFPNLKMIQRSGVGLDSIDLDAVRDRGLSLYVNQGVNSNSVAEFTIMLMLACLRNLTNANTNTHNGLWLKHTHGLETHELKNMTVGIIGMGSIGQRVASLLVPFGPQVIYYSRTSRSPLLESQLKIKYSSFDNLLAEADITSLHCPLNESTKELINRDSLSRMKQGSILINTARGPLIEGDALYEALNSGKLSFAALDAHSIEPIDKNNRFLGLSNIILTPHISGITYESFKDMIEKAMLNIQMYEQGSYDQIKRFRINLM